MAKRKKRVATVNRKLGTAIGCRVQRPFLTDLDAYWYRVTFLKALKAFETCGAGEDRHRPLRQPKNPSRKPVGVCEREIMKKAKRKRWGSKRRSAARPPQAGPRPFQ